MVSNKTLGLITAGALSLAAFGQNALSIAPIPPDPLEIVTGSVQPVEGGNRDAALQLLARARNNYALRTAGQAYDLNVSFVVNSGGQTQFDGAWRMDDVFDPKLGSRWTAKMGTEFAMTRITSNGKSYSDATLSYIPLRLHEARVALLGPIPSAADVERAAIRTSLSTFNGRQVICVLTSGSGNAGNTAPARRWEETEECIDPVSGLLQVHSQVPGRYYAYDYSDAPRLNTHVMPRKVIVTEGGSKVSEISVDGLTELPAADPGLFIPSAEMQEKGQAIGMAGAQKISRVFERGAPGSGITGPAVSPAVFTPGAVHTVCVFGLVTPSGQLVEAHSLQPSDPHSQAAVEAAKKMNFARPTPPGQVAAPPLQHFVFIIEKFVSTQ